MIISTKTPDYAFIETTNLSFIGVPPQTLIGNETLQSNPIIIPVGTGRKIYHRGNETRYINENYRISDIKVHDLENQVKSKEPDLSAQRQQIGQPEAQIQHLKNAGNIREYNALVPTHNALVSDYNSRMATYRQIVARYQKYADLHNYILDHQYDRKGVYEYVRENIPV